MEEPRVHFSGFAFAAPSPPTPSHRSSPYTKKCKLPGCDRPRYFDQDLGCLHDFCSRTHAKVAENKGIGRKLQAPHKLCRYPGCENVVWADPISGRSEDFCGRTHAKMAIEEGYWPPSTTGLPRPQRTCGLPGCQKLVYFDPSLPERSYDFCGRSHSLLAAERRLLAPSTPGVDRVWCGPQGDYSVSLLTRQHEKFDSIKEQFLTTWRHVNTPRIRVQRILQIRNPPEIYEKYNQYLAKVGNEQRRFHGTSMQCSFGIDLKAAPCDDAKCAVCNICQTGFSLKYTGVNSQFLRFGHGLYFSSTSSKSHSYNVNSERNGNHQKPWRVMFLCRVAVGKGFVCDGTEPLTEPPRGFNSIIGEPGKALNYDEVVVYDERAAIPSYLIAYSLG